MSSLPDCIGLGPICSVILDLPIAEGRMSQLAYTYVALPSALDNQSDIG